MQVTILADELGVWIEWPGGPQTVAEPGCIVLAPNDDYQWLPETRWHRVAYVPNEVLACRDLESGALFTWDLRSISLTAIVQHEGAFVAVPA